jgi:uncharacterized membrane protein YeaQ/YmgE (transglycosylase-associated protein family)
MLLLSTNIWLAGNKLAFFLLQAAREKGASGTTEDFSTWGTTYKVKWSTLVGAIVIGLIAGLLARRLTPGKEAMGLITTIILGIAGSIVGGLIGSLIWRNETGSFRPGELLLSVLGAILLLLLWKRRS